MQKDEFEAVYTRYYRVVYAYLISLCRDESLAAELTQETFFKALKAIDRFDGRCPVNVWLCRIAKNAQVDAARKASRTAPAEALPDPPDPDAGPAQKAETHDEAMRVHRALHRLPDPYREVFWLRVYGELNFADIARLFEKTESWARVTYYRAKTKLREELT